MVQGMGKNQSESKYKAMFSKLKLCIQKDDSQGKNKGAGILISHSECTVPTLGRAFPTHLALVMVEFR